MSSAWHLLGWVSTKTQRLIVNWRGHVKTNSQKRKLIIQTDGCIWSEICKNFWWSELSAKPTNLKHQPSPVWIRQWRVALKIWLLAEHSFAYQTKKDVLGRDNMWEPKLPLALSSERGNFGSHMLLLPRTDFYFFVRRDVIFFLCTWSKHIGTLSCEAKWLACSCKCSSHGWNRKSVTGSVTGIKIPWLAVGSKLWQPRAKLTWQPLQDALSVIRRRWMVKAWQQDRVKPFKIKMKFGRLGPKLSKKLPTHVGNDRWRQKCDLAVARLFSHGVVTTIPLRLSQANKS